MGINVKEIIYIPRFIYSYYENQDGFYFGPPHSYKNVGGKYNRKTAF